MRYEYNGDEVFFVLKDPQGDSDFLLSKAECELRLRNLRENGLPGVDEMEEAIKNWPSDKK